MHKEARRGFLRAADSAGVDLRATMRVLDIGGQNVNGTVWDTLPNATIDVLDINPNGAGVTIVADARTWQPPSAYELVISTELLEHVDGWQYIIATARKAVADNGALLLTAASTGRGRHGANGEPLPPDGEHYGNVDPHALAGELLLHFRDFGVTYQRRPGDVYAWARP